MMTHRNNTGGIIGGSILIGLGVLFLLAQVFNFAAWQFLWPFVVMGVGGVFFVGMVAGGKSTAALAIPGTIISGIGLMLFFQNLTGRWNSWAYGWTVILMLVGLGLWIMGRWGDNAHQRHSGMRLMKLGLVFFIIFGALFEFVFSNAGGPDLRRVLFPVLLILLGLYLTIRRTLWPPRRTDLPPDSPTPPAPQPPQGQAS